ncbi:MAG: imidazoleglycerol-phosphate dehydratase [Acidobacteriia bacterium]|nr:imidazoleglycerol-phosphate dehydratase [Terriglobia bacterium]
MSERKASIIRTTELAEVKAVLDLDGKGSAAVQTGSPFLDHMLTLFARHGAFDLEVHCRAAGETDPHHLLEEVAFCLGLALDKALGDKRGLLRSGHSCAPVEEHLARAVVEFSGHPCLVYRVRASAPSLGGVDAGEIENFWKTFVAQARFTLHIELLYGGGGLPAYEALFKAAARAVSDACRLQGSSSQRVGVE